MSEEKGMVLGAVLGPHPEPPIDIKAALLAIADRPLLLRGIRLRLEMCRPLRREAEFPKIIRAIAENMP